MVLLFFILVLAGVSLSILAFSPSHKAQQNLEKDKKTPSTDNLKIQIDSLKTQLQKINLDYQNLQKELALTQGRESDLTKNLERFKDWDNREQTDLEKIQREYVKLKEQLIAKEKEIEQGFAMNVNFNRELNEYKEKLTILEKENKEMLSGLRMFEAKNTGLQKEVERQNKVITELKNKEEESEWISKNEYNELKTQLAAKEEELKKLRSG